MKLIDVIRSRAKQLNLSENFIESISSATVFDIQNVADYYFFGTDQENWSEDDFPNVAPPFGTMWFEWTIPNRIFSKGVMQRYHNLGKDVQMGVLALSWEANDPNLYEQIKFEGFDLESMMAAGVKWVSIYSTFFAIHQQPIGRQPYLIFAIGIDEKGEITLDKNGKDRLVFSFFQSQDEKSLVSGSHIHPVLMALSFMHCKNVELQDRTLPPKVRKKQENKFNKITFRWNTLLIEPMKAIVKQASQQYGTGIKHSLHICRGHFKDFSRGEGLFGKHKGLYWWNANVRGSVHVGEVGKDYKI